MLILPSVPDAKWCPECGRFKALADFYTDRRSSDGKTVYCKPCTSVRNAESKARRARGERIERRRPKRTLHGYAVEKRCPACGETKPLDAFAVNRTNNREIGAYCLPCHNEIVRENVEVRACAICLVKPAEHVDHDHETGDVRGILCFTCNVGLGSVNDEPDRPLLAHRYLTRPRSAAERLRRLNLGRAS